MSDLQEILVTLESVNRDADRNARDLAAQATRLSKATAVVSAMVAHGTTASGATTTATALKNAERAVTAAARQLHHAAIAGRGYISRHAIPAGNTPAPNGGNPRTGSIAYGDPHPTHGTSPAVNPADITPAVAALKNLNEPYGRDIHNGHVLTHDEYDARYTDAKDEDRYPPNAGAVVGTTVSYGSVNDFIRDHGNLVDRIGEPEGGYLGLRVEGKPATFDARALPLSSLTQPYNAYELTGTWVKGWRLEVSEVSPAFGRGGGGTQLRILNSDGSEVKVAEALKRGVLK